jgi:hypothetical protein
MKRLPRAEIVLPFVIALAASILIASELMTAFEFTPPGGEALREVSSADRHDYSMLLLGLFAVIAMLIAITTGARPAAYAVAALGGIALLMFLIMDLPDAGKLGDLEDPIRGFASARAEPQEGFWLEAIGAVFLALAGGAFATLSSEQLKAPLARFNRGKPGDAKQDPESQPAAATPADRARPSH